MSNLIQLNPPIPVKVVPKEGNGPAWPTGPGHCFGWLDYTQEHNTLWLIGYDTNGELWWVPQSHVRLQTNISMDRPKETK